MERFLKIKAGMDIRQVEEILNEKLVIEKRREEHFKSDIVYFEDMGVWLFFKPETSTLYTIRYEAPFNLAVDGVQIGDTKKKTKELKGAALRIAPFPTQTEIAWIYGEAGEFDWVRYDFEKARNGKCIKIYK